MFVAKFETRKTLSAALVNRVNLSATLGLGGVSMAGGVTTRIVNITLLADAWEGSESPYSQVVEVENATEYSLVDLQPSVEQLEIFHDKDIAFTAENEDGVVTVFAVGDKPTQDYIIQATVTEVKV